MTITADTKLTAEVLDALGFVRQPAEPGRPATHALVRYQQRIEVRADAAGWGYGWDLGGMKPLDVGDLLVMLVSTGVKAGRRELTHEFLEVVGFTDAADWVNGALNALRFPPAPKKRAAKKPVKKAAKKPNKKLKGRAK